MNMSAKLKTLARDLKHELAVLRLIRKHPRTPTRAKVLLAAAVGYLVLPFDLIPDWIPVLGQLDDAVIVPGLVWLAYKMVPKDVIEECRAQAARESEGSKHEIQKPK